MILSLGLHPKEVDYSSYPDLDEEKLTARIEAAVAELRDAGFDVVACQVVADPDEAAAQVRECVAGHQVDTVMIGAGVRMAAEHTVLFERLVNLVVQLVPGVVFCFNTSPESTIDALRRATRGR